MINTNDLRRKVNSTDVEDHIYLHANIRPLLTELLDRLEAAEKERDALRTKVEAMERQKPVAHVWRCDNGHIHGSCESELPMGQQLYAAPGAKGEEK